MSNLLDTLNGKKVDLTPEYAWKLYNKGIDYKRAINLYDTVKVNENFFIGKQWEGVVSNGLPTPVFNVLKRTCSFIVASITSDNLKVNAAPLAATANTKDLIEPARIVNEELDALTERNRIPALVGEYARNAAVDGDGCLYTYWDDEEETGQDAKGGIKTEVVENTRVHFGNPSDRHVQSQPWIIISKRALRGEVILRAKENGQDWENIQATDDPVQGDYVKHTDDKVDLCLLFWRDRETKEIWCYEFTENCAVREPWSLGIKLYPLVWLNWDYIIDSYHGQAMITGLIPNQIFINKAWAASMLSLLTMAYPKIIYDKSRIRKWDNRVGAAIGTAGDVNNAARVMEGANFSPQIGQFLQLAKSETESTLGATSVAMGETRPDNTSAIIALQRAAATPSERTKQNIYASIEELYRIYVAFMAEYYGKRTVDMEPTDEIKQQYAFAGQEPPAEIAAKFDFKKLKDMPMTLKLDVGASSYYSEVASIQTLSNLLQQGVIDGVQFLERVPDGYVPGRRELINELKQRMTQAQQMPQEEAGAPEVMGGPGYGHLQRVINETGTTEGVV